MFNNIFRGCFSIGATSAFEKSRLQATYAGDNLPPDEEDLSILLNSLRGHDLEVKDIVAYETIVTKCELSESRTKWNYLIKNLIILDRATNDRLFLQKLMDLSSKTFSTFQAQKEKDKQQKLDQFVRQYFDYVKKKAGVYYRTKSTSITGRKKKDLLKQLPIQQVIDELKLMQSFNDFILSLDSICNELLTYKVNQYAVKLIFIQLIQQQDHQYSLIAQLSEKLTSLTLFQAQEFESSYNKFIYLLKQNKKFISDFPVIEDVQLLSQDEIYQQDQKLFQSIIDYKKLREDLENKQSYYDQQNVVRFDKSLIKGMQELYVDKRNLETPFKRDQQLKMNNTIGQSIMNLQQQQQKLPSNNEFVKLLTQSQDYSADKTKLGDLLQQSDIQVVTPLEQSYEKVKQFDQNEAIVKSQLLGDNLDNSSFQQQQQSSQQEQLVIEQDQEIINQLISSNSQQENNPFSDITLTKSNDDTLKVPTSTREGVNSISSDRLSNLRQYRFEELPEYSVFDEDYFATYQNTYSKEPKTIDLQQELLNQTKQYSGFATWNIIKIDEANGSTADVSGNSAFISNEDDTLLDQANMMDQFRKGSFQYLTKVNNIRSTEVIVVTADQWSKYDKFDHQLFSNFRNVLSVIQSVKEDDYESPNEQDQGQDQTQSETVQSEPNPTETTENNTKKTKTKKNKK